MQFWAVKSAPSFVGTSRQRTMTVVVDASAAVEIALASEISQRFREVLNDADVVLAPDTFPWEITNVFWK